MRRKHRRLLAAFLGRCVQAWRIAGYHLLSGNTVEGAPRRLQPLQAMGRGRIWFGDNVTIGVYRSPRFFSSAAYIEARRVTARISVGSGTTFSNGVVAIADHSSISIGTNCLIGAGVEILDGDFHGIRIADRQITRPEWCRPVTIGNDVFCGSNVRIGKGVTIGDGAVIANGSIVIHDIPPHVVAAGAPARAVRKIDNA